MWIRIKSAFVLPFTDLLIVNAGLIFCAELRKFFWNLKIEESIFDQLMDQAL